MAGDDNYLAKRYKPPYNWLQFSSEGLNMALVVVSLFMLVFGIGWLVYAKYEEKGLHKKP